MIDGLCTKYGALPSAILAEGLELLRVNAILALVDQEAKPENEMEASLGDLARTRGG